MVTSCVSVWGKRVFAAIGIAGTAASILVSLSSPAEARRRHHRGGGYNPPFAAVVVDAKTGRTLHAQNENELRHPASVTKVMTLYILFEQLERGRLSLNTPLRVSAHAAEQAPSKLGLDPGDTIAVEDAIKALVTKSANDVAAAVAENLAGSEEAFAEHMTQKARSLGMSRTVYRNASGLPDPEQVTTARDLTILARAIQDRFPRYYPYFQTRVFHYAGESHRNHNKLLGRIEGVDGIKTGYTRASGFNLMTNVKTDDRHIVAVVLGGRSGASRDQTVASLIRTHLPRAYAGARSAPVTAEADRSRPAAVAEATRPARSHDVESTAATVPAGRPNRPLDLNPMRAAVASAAGANSTTTPSAMSRWSAGASALPQAAQAYAPQAETASRPTTVASASPAMAVAPTSAPPASPTGKIEARLPSVSEIAIARAEPPPALAQPLPPAPVAQHARRETARAPASAWVIQLGAMDDEDKAKSMLEEAKSRSGRSLAHAAPFTEKVVRDGTTLYRARFSGFDEADDAQEACRHLKRSGFACFATRS